MSNGVVQVPQNALDGVLVQTRGYVSGTGATRYLHRTQITTAGDLPDTGWFLKQIVDARAPALDRFARVCGPKDITDFGMDRAAAVRAGAVYYRVATFQRWWEDLSAAQEDAAMVRSLCSRLAAIWRQVQEAWLTDADGEQYTLPLPQDSLVEERTEAYETALAQRDAASARVTTAIAAEVQANQAVTRLVSHLATIRTAHATASTTRAALAQVRAILTDGLVDAVQEFLAEVSAGIAAYSAESQSANPSYNYFADPDDEESGEDDEGSVTALIPGLRQAAWAANGQTAAIDGQMTSLTAQVAALGTAVLDVESALTSAQRVALAAQRERMAAQTDLVGKEAALSEARVALETVDPDYFA